LTVGDKREKFLIAGGMLDLGVFMPGSPTPFEMGLRGITDAMGQLSSQAIPAIAIPGVGSVDSGTEAKFDSLINKTKTLGEASKSVFKSIATSTTSTIELTKEWDRILGGIEGKYNNIAENANALNPAAQTGAAPSNATNEQLNR
jgi:hypothetical protein